jgi:Fe-S cluster biogenesis protein NfuA
MMLEDVKIRFAVDTIAHALQSDGSQVKFLDFDDDLGRVRIAAWLNPDCEHCVMTPDQLQSLLKDMVEEQLGRPVTIQMSDL